MGEKITWLRSAGWGSPEGRGPGQWESRARRGDITPPASGHRFHSVAKCGRAEDARSPWPAVNPVRARQTASITRRTNRCGSTAQGYCPLHVPGSLRCFPLFFFHRLITIITFPRTTYSRYNSNNLWNSLRSSWGPRKPTSRRWLPLLAVTTQRPEEGSQHQASSSNCSRRLRTLHVGRVRPCLSFLAFSVTVIFVSRRMINFQLVSLKTFI